jgi:methenyltetrahydrofolate cyclohydrolase
LNHPASTSILDLTLRDLLDRLGSSDPSPGGGAAAALAGALGAALVQMTANLTLGRPRLAEVQPQARDIADRAGALRARLSALADADAAAYTQVRAAYRLPREDDNLKATRAVAIQEALRVAARVPLDTAARCADVLRLAEEAAPILNASVISDVVVGAMLAQAGLESAIVNVEINLHSMTETQTVQRLAAELDEVGAGARERTQRAVQAGRSRFPAA